MNLADALYPMLFTPCYKEYLWGGSNIAQVFHRDFVPEVCAESWEISVHPDGPSVLRNGPLAGKTLEALVSSFGDALLGARAPGGRFPLLLKILDARKRLSVQVHPNTAAARRFGGEPKTEAWVVLHAEKGALVYAGLAPGVDEAALRAAAEQPSIADCLARYSVQAGDVIFVPGGRVHAVGAGCLIYEVQQTSNTTYRIHDWGHKDAQGRPRELHLEQAMQVIGWEDQESARRVPSRVEDGEWGTRDLLCESDFFRMERIDWRGAYQLPEDPGTFQVLFTAEGGLRLEESRGPLEIPPGTSCLLPAALGPVTGAPAGDAATCLRVTLP